MVILKEQVKDVTSKSKHSVISFKKKNDTFIKDDQNKTI